MAGVIQLNSTTLATESSGSITAELDTIRPNTTNGSLTLQGDSSNAGVTGLTIDSSGVVNTTSAKVTNIQATSGQSLTIKDEDGNAAITIGTDNTAVGYLSLNFGSYHGDSGGVGGGTLSGNTLDDYEEGTWTPTNYTGGTVSGNNYTKIGRLVTVSCFFSSVTFSGNSIGGLPFASLSYGVGSISFSNSTNIDSITSGGSSIDFRQTASNGSTFNSSATPNGNAMMLSVTYQI